MTAKCKGSYVMGRFIPLSVPNFEGNERKYVDDAVDQGWVSTAGAYVVQFEEKLESFLHTKNVSACQSGTAALHLSLIEAGVQPGDVVIVPTLTFIAAVNPVMYRFASPVFMDCDDSLCMDPVKLRGFCEEECDWDGCTLRYRGAAVKAIVVVHVFGNMADMESIMDTAGKYGLKVIEDATEALGTQYTEGRYKGRYAGTIGHFGAFSFNGNKIITTGGGGAVTASEAAAVDHMRFISTQAKTDPDFFIHDEVGYNYRMTNVQAAIGVAQMELLPEFIGRKQRNYRLYQSEFDSFACASLLPFREGTESNMWFYSLSIDRSKVTAPMREIISELRKKGIQTRAVWGLIHQQKPYAGEKAYRIEKALYYADRILNIPSSSQITPDEIKFVSDEIKNLLRELANG